MEKLLQQDEDENVCLSCDGQKFEGNRRKLAKQSPYFKAMFFGQLKESQCKEAIPIYDVSATSLQTLILYSETLHFTPTTENCFHMLEAATLFQFDGIQTACVNFIRSELNVGTCLDAMCIADFLSIDGLFKAALHFALWEFNMLSRRSEIMDLPKERLASYLSENGLCTASEMNVFHCLERWIRHDPDNRHEHLFDLLHVIRFGELSLADIAEMLDSKVVKDAMSIELIQRIKELKRENSTLLKSNTESNQLAKSLLKVPRRSIRMVPIIICHMFTDIHTDPIADIAYYDEKTQTFHKVTTLQRIYKRIVGTMQYNINAVGQELYVTEKTFERNDKALISPIWRYNLITAQWKICTSIPIPRRLQCTCVLDNCIYIVGGIDSRREPMTDLCCFNPKTGEWKTLQPLPQPVFSYYYGCCTVHKGCIYVFANEVSRYDPKLDSWTIETILPKVTIRILLSYENDLYFIVKNRQLFRYHPKLDGSVFDGTCTALCRFIYSLGGVWLSGDKLYAFNYDKSNRCIIEVYNFTTDTIYVECKSDVGAPEIVDHCPIIPVFDL